MRRIRSKPVDVEINEGIIAGIIYYDIEWALNWATGERLDENSIEYIQSLNAPVTILENFYVLSDKRRQGFGKQLLNSFIEKSEGPVLLLGIQNKGFDLIKWYKSYDFEVIGYDFAGSPFMVLH